MLAEAAAVAAAGVGCLSPGFGDLFCFVVVVGGQGVRKGSVWVGLGWWLVVKCFF